MTVFYDKNRKTTELSRKMGKILNYSLQLECFEDHTHEKIPLLYETEEKLADLRDRRDELDEETKMRKADEIIQNFEEVIDLIGRDKFWFYDDDGTIEYKWGKE